MTATTTYQTVEESFSRVYEQLRIDNNENAPDSNVYLAPTLDKLAEDTDGGYEDQIDQAKEGVYETLGAADGQAVAWAIELNGFSVYRITDAANESELNTFFGQCMGYDL